MVQDNTDLTFTNTSELHLKSKPADSFNFFSVKLCARQTQQAQLGIYMRNQESPTSLDLCLPESFILDAEGAYVSLNTRLTVQSHSPNWINSCLLTV